MSARIRLPGTALEVSTLCLGGNRLGGELDRDRSFALLDAFVAAGGNFVDTAHVYADWLPGAERSCSEKMIGRWRAARGAGGGVVVATKIGHPVLGRPESRRLDRASLREDVAAARENLGQECLDLVYLHRDDPDRDVAEIIGVMEELRGEGALRHYAASNWSGARLAAATAAAGRPGWEGFRANQPEWSLAVRNPGTAAPDLRAMDGAMIAWHRATGTAAVPYSAQARGFFDRLAAGATGGPAAAAFDNAASRARGAALAALAAARGVTPTQAMLALFPLAGFPVVPVVGCRTPAQIAASFRGIALALSAAEAAPLLAALVGLAPGTGARE